MSGTAFERALTQLAAEIHSADHIRAAAAPVPPRAAGIYFLLDGEEIIYVGKSVNLISRLQTHQTEAEKQNAASKKFDAYVFLPCPEEMLDVIEALYIRKFDPRDNRKMPGDR